MKATIKNVFHSRHLRFFLLQVLVLVGIWLIVTLAMFSLASHNAAIGSSKTIGWVLFLIWISFMVNYYILVPWLFFSNKYRIVKRILLLVVNIMMDNVPMMPLILSFHSGFNFTRNMASIARDSVAIGIYTFLLTWTFFGLLTMGLAIAARNYERQRRIKQMFAEEKQKNTEAELAWLKNQLNPHFLFNTLNNISSLVQINPDDAQDRIAQLSNLLRYALYETKNDFVELDQEIEFLHNYISLMSLRCGDNVEITTELDPQLKGSGALVAPMLFLSPIENAFKHGVSSNQPSFIHIALRREGDKLVFICENSNHPKDKNNHSGSGIGIDNMKRRLALLYPNCHSYSGGLDGEVYKVRIEIWKN
ncbi:MAG: sensor histidine kinase [Prevotella sp.]|jgi:sensor histidine kinase YesM